MLEVSLLSIFLAGLLGGPHCFGMCGGLVAAMTGVAGERPKWSLHWGYNLGRITSYVVAGAAVGGLGGLLTAGGGMAVQLTLLAASGLVLIGMGMYLLGLPQGLLPLERIGGRLWSCIQPFGRRFLPVRRFSQAVGLGVIWGWLPCGLVYTALVAALASGSAAGGALCLLAFGLGTLPNLLAAGVLAAKLRPWMQQIWVRRCAGVIVMAFGVKALVGVIRLI